MATDNVTPEKSDGGLLVEDDWNQHIHTRGGFSGTVGPLLDSQTTAETQYTGGTGEVTLATITVGTGTVDKGIMIHSDVQLDNLSAGTANGTIRLKVGTAGSETLIESSTVGSTTAQSTNFGYSMNKWVSKDTIDFSSRHNNVIVTVQPGNITQTYRSREFTVVRF